MEGGATDAHPWRRAGHAHPVRAGPLFLRGPQRQAPRPALPEVAGRGSAAQPAPFGPVCAAGQDRRRARGPESGGPAPAPRPAGAHPWQRHAMRPPHGRDQHGRSGGHLLPLLRAGGQLDGAARPARRTGGGPDPGVHAGVLPAQPGRKDHGHCRV